MELRLDEIRNSSDPYQLFLHSLQNKHTFRKYKNSLNEFLRLVPSKIYDEELMKSPEDRDLDHETRKPYCTACNWDL